MIPSAALLAHERLCPDCLGEGKVAEVRPCTSSTATEPFLATGNFIECHTCRAGGVVVNEQRAWPRTDSTAHADFERLRATADAFLERALTAEHALDCANDHIDRLLVENRDLRSALTGWGRVLKTAARC